MGQKIIIGVSKLSPNYANWLNTLHEGLDIVDLYDFKIRDLTANIHSFSGILLSGGSDVHPALYGREEDISLCKNIDSKCDELETKLIKLAMQKRIPLLGICRGQQILNVVCGGSLFSDISTFARSKIIHSGEKDVYHTVNIDPGSFLYKITQAPQEVVNSSHHQAINKVAAGFTVSARSDDDIIEAIEWANAAEYPFCVAIQWHPERMGLENPLSGKLGMRFIEEAMKKEGVKG